jgi:prepilin-type N-terminal cleavage/methylation domain-containing protein
LTGGAIWSDSHYGRKIGFPLEKGEIMLYDVADKGMKTGNKEPSLMRRRTKKEGGFSLIEVLITIFILGIVCITMISVFIYGFNLLQKTKSVAVATQFAQEEVEKYREKKFDLVTNVSTTIAFTTANFPVASYPYLFREGGTPFLGNGQAQTVIENGADINIKKLTVRVFWDYRGQQQNRYVVTYISREGVNRR